MKFGLRFALLAQTKCQNLSPSSRLSRVTRLSSSLSSDRPSYDYTSEDCTVVFDADGAYCMEEAALMSRVNVENCIRDSANPARTRRPRSIAPRHRRNSPVDVPAGGRVRRVPEVPGAHGPHHPEEAQAEVADGNGRRLRGLLRGVHRPPALTSPAPSLAVSTRRLSTCDIEIETKDALRPYYRVPAPPRLQVVFWACLHTAPPGFRRQFRS